MLLKIISGERDMRSFRFFRSHRIMFVSLWGKLLIGIDWERWRFGDCALAAANVWHARKCASQRALSAQLRDACAGHAASLFHGGRGWLEPAAASHCFTWLAGAVFHRDSHCRPGQAVSPVTHRTPRGSTAICYHNELYYDDDYYFIRTHGTYIHTYGTYIQKKKKKISHRRLGPLRGSSSPFQHFEPCLMFFFKFSLLWWHWVCRTNAIILRCKLSGIPFKMEPIKQKQR